MVATPICSEKNKKASSTFLSRSQRRFILHTDTIAKTACSLCAPCCCLAALAQPYELFLCVSTAYSFAMPDHTKSSHVVLWASWLAPRRSATLHFLVGASHSRPHPASQGRRGGRRSAVTAGSEQLIFINNKRQKYNRKILKPFDSINRKPSKKIKYKKRPQKYQCSPPHSPVKKTKRQPP